MRECIKEFTAENTGRGDDDDTIIIGDDDDTAAAAVADGYDGTRQMRRATTKRGKKMRSIYTREICRIGKTCRHNNNNINSPGVSHRLLSDFKSLFTSYI